MKKIWILAGIILLIVLLLGSWLFVIKFGGFANFLGEKSSSIQNSTKYDFVGIWETENPDINNFIIGEGGRYSFLLTGKGTFGGISGNWNISDSKLYINCTEELSYIYGYRFSKEKDTLNLTIDGSEIEFKKI